MRREGRSTTHHDDKKNKRILLVDDEQDVTYTIKIVLENNGFLVDSYNDPTWRCLILNLDFMTYYSLILGCQRSIVLICIKR